MGNSEVGHLNIGAGRVVDQDIVRISKVDRASTSSQQNPTLRRRREGRAGRALRRPALRRRRALAAGASARNDRRGARRSARRTSSSTPSSTAATRRRNPPRSTSAICSITSATSRKAHLATVIGRYFTMDRDHRWERVQRGYDLMTLGVGTETKDPLETDAPLLRAGRHRRVHGADLGPHAGRRASRARSKTATR